MTSSVLFFVFNVPMQEIYVKSLFLNIFDFLLKGQMGIWHSAECTQEEHWVFNVLKGQRIVIFVAFSQALEIVLIADELKEDRTYPMSVVQNSLLVDTQFFCYGTATFTL